MPAGYLRCGQVGLDQCVCMYLCLSADSSHYCELHCPHHHLHSVCYRGSVFVCTILVKLHGSELNTEPKHKTGSRNFQVLVVVFCITGATWVFVPMDSLIDRLCPVLGMVIQHHSSCVPGTGL